MARTPSRPQKAKPRRKALHNAPVEVSQGAFDHLTGRGDPQQRFRLYRLCVCLECLGEGKVVRLTTGNEGTTRHYQKCRECRGEGKTLDLVATCATPQDLGCKIVTLAKEDEFEGCPIGILEDGGSWLVKPWLPSARNVADAARVLAKSRKKGKGEQ